MTIVTTTPIPSAATLALPPLGFNHRYGNNPLAAKDGFTLERALFAQQVYWEVALRTDPMQAGFVDLADRKAVAAARRAVTSLTVVIATEARFTIRGLLAYGGDQGQEMYCEQLLRRLRATGYDGITSARVLVFFTEADEHAQLSWSLSAGYSFAVYDGDLSATGFTPAPGETPLPAPDGP